MNDFAIALLAMTGSAAAEGEATPLPSTPIMMAMQVVERRIIIRIPVRRPLRRSNRGSRPPPPINWQERPAADCHPAQQVARARFIRPGVVDFLMRDRRVLRARLDNECVNLGYYNAFYLVPGDDGRVCVNRDLLQSRAGGQCTIASFHRLRGMLTR